MKFLSFITTKWALFFVAGICVGTTGCSKKTFTAMKWENVDQGQNNNGNGSTNNGGTTAGVTTGNTNNGNSIGGTNGNGSITNNNGSTNAGNNTTGTTNNGGNNGGTNGSGTTNGNTVGGTTNGNTTNNNGGNTNGNTVGGNTNGATNGPTPPTPQYCIVENYKQPAAQITRKLDLLIVVDTSSSMDDERAEVAAGIKNYISKLPANTNARFAVMLAHGPTSWFSGRLYKSDFKDPREKFVISTEDYSADDIQKWMNRKLRYRQRDYSVRAFTNDSNIAYMDPTKGVLGLPTDYDAGGGEAGIYTIYETFRDYPEGVAARYKSIQNLHNEQPGERNFFRSDAALGVIFMSDENDLCYPDASVPDTNGGIEITFYNAHCKGKVTVEGVLQKMQSVRQSLPFYISSIIYNTPGNVPSGLENGIGYGYNKIAQLSGGNIIDITSGKNAIPPGLNNIASYMASVLNLRHDFILKYQNVESPTIQVKADNGGNNSYTVRAHSYSSTTNTVHVTNPGNANANVTIRYCLNKGAALNPYQVQISSFLMQAAPKTYQPTVVIEEK